MPYVLVLPVGSRHVKQEKELQEESKDGETGIVKKIKII